MNIRTSYWARPPACSLLPMRSIHHHRHGEQWRHDPHAEVDGRLHQAKNPDIQLNWVTLEENSCGERVTIDIATKGGQYDVMTIGTYEVPIWAKQQWRCCRRQSRRRLRRRRHHPGDPRRFVGRRQALRRAVLRRVVLRHVPQRPVREVRLTMPDAPTWDFVGTARLPARSRPTMRTSTASACAARPAGARTWPS
ncbi:MAG: hypothetical protein R3E51_16175 [Rhizobiaceae bacterium]